jgi:hypothetical protein
MFSAGSALQLRVLALNGGMKMKRTAASIGVIAFSLMLGATQLLARNQDDKIRHRHVSATELASAGIVAAVMVGGAGYLLLRRRARLSK